MLPGPPKDVWSEKRSRIETEVHTANHADKLSGKWPEKKEKTEEEEEDEEKVSAETNTPRDDPKDDPPPPPAGGAPGPSSGTGGSGDDKQEDGAAPGSNETQGGGGSKPNPNSQQMQQQHLATLEPWSLKNKTTTMSVASGTSLSLDGTPPNFSASSSMVEYSPSGFDTLGSPTTFNTSPLQVNYGVHTPTMAKYQPVSGPAVGNYEPLPIEKPPPKKPAPVQEDSKPKAIVAAKPPLHPKPTQTETVAKKPTMEGSEDASSSDEVEVSGIKQAEMQKEKDDSDAVEVVGEKKVEKEKVDTEDDQSTKDDTPLAKHIKNPLEDDSMEFKSDTDEDYNPRNEIKKREEKRLGRKPSKHKNKPQKPASTKPSKSNTKPKKPASSQPNQSTVASSKPKGSTVEGEEKSARRSSDRMKRSPSTYEPEDDRQAKKKPRTPRSLKPGSVRQDEYFKQLAKNERKKG